jgi:uncharacterized membrane protein (DUF2068 family)
MKKDSPAMIVAIGVFRLVKATFLFGAGATLLIASPVHIANAIQKVLTGLGTMPGYQTAQTLADKFDQLDDGSIKRFALAMIGYGTVFLVEGVGLVLRKRWAEWLTVVVTTSFIPIEIYELVKHPGAGKVGALVINIAIVLYLVARRLGWGTRSSLASLLARVKI